MRLTIVLISLSALFVACKKKPQVEHPAPTKWELVPGHYKVYDSTGVFIYEMNIEYSSGTSELGYHIDSLHFDKLDNQFDLTIKQETFCNLTTGNTKGKLTGFERNLKILVFIPIS